MSERSIPVATPWQMQIAATEPFSAFSSQKLVHDLSGQLSCLDHCKSMRGGSDASSFLSLFQVHLPPCPQPEPYKLLCIGCVADLSLRQAVQKLCPAGEPQLLSEGQLLLLCEPCACKLVSFKIIVLDVGIPKVLPIKLIRLRLGSSWSYVCLSDAPFALSIIVLMINATCMSITMIAHATHKYARLPGAECSDGLFFQH